MKYSINKSTIDDIADAIREKTETTDKMKPTAMAELIKSISGGGDVPINFDYTEFMSPSTINLNGGYEFDHPLEDVPNFVVLFSTNPESPSGTYPLREAISWQVVDGSDFQLVQRTNAGDSPIVEFSMDDTTVYIKTGYQCMLLGLHNYILVVGKIE